MRERELNAWIDATEESYQRRIRELQEALEQRGAELAKAMELLKDVPQMVALSHTNKRIDAFLARIGSKP